MQPKIKLNRQNIKDDKLRKIARKHGKSTANNLLKKESKYIQNRKAIDVSADLTSLFIIFVGDTRFELVTPCLSSKCSARLS